MGPGRNWVLAASAAVPAMFLPNNLLMHADVPHRTAPGPMAKNLSEELC